VTITFTTTCYYTGMATFDAFAAAIPIEAADPNPGNNKVGFVKANASVEPADADGDAVDAVDDECEGTLPGHPVDAVGCSDGQVDHDGDGICDPGAPSDGPAGCTGSDNCPSIANSGQGDTDNDGTADACEPSAPISVGGIVGLAGSNAETTAVEQGVGTSGGLAPAAFMSAFSLGSGLLFAVAVRVLRRRSG
jgi:hypothetical protein